MGRSLVPKLEEVHRVPWPFPCWPSVSRMDTPY
jgi:hypothetical protein